MQRVRASDHPWGTRVVLCAPERRNALDPQAVDELLAIFTRDAPGALLLTAEGPAFCAGGDLAVLGRAAASGDLAGMLLANAARFADLVEAIVASPRPVVAVIDGPAVGGGVSLAMACDTRLATPRARLVLGWSRLGLPPDGHATTLLAWALGRDRSRSLLAAATEITPDSDVAPRAFTRVVDPAGLEDAALAEVQHAQKAADRGLLLSAMRAARAEELAALARAAADEGTGERLAVLYKIDR